MAYITNRYFIYFPLPLPIRFVPCGYGASGNQPIDPRYNTTPFDGDWYSNQVPEYNDIIQNSLCQKIENLDRVIVEYHAGVIVEYPAGYFHQYPILLRLSTSVMDLLDINMNVVHSYSPKWTDIIAGLTATKNGITDKLQTFLYDFTLQSLGLAEGIYYLRTKTGVFQYDAYGHATVSYIYHISEPLDVRAKHPNTLLIQFNGIRNDFNNRMIFYNPAQANIPVYFSYRVEGYICECAPQSSDTVYEDISYNLIALNYLPYRTFKLIIGKMIYLPRYAVDKAARAILYTNVLIDGNSYIKKDGATWDFNTIDNNEIVSGSILLRETDNQQGGLSASGIPFKLFAAGSYPYNTGTGTLTIDGLYGIEVLTFPAKAITDGITEQAYVDNLNAQRYVYELQGVFAITIMNDGTNNIVYLPAIGELVIGINVSTSKDHTDDLNSDFS